MRLTTLDSFLPVLHNLKVSLKRLVRFQNDKHRWNNFSLYLSVILLWFRKQSDYRGLGRIEIFAGRRLVPNVTWWGRRESLFFDCSDYDSIFVFVSHQRVRNYCSNTNYSQEVSTNNSEWPIRLPGGGWRWEGWVVPHIYIVPQLCTLMLHWPVRSNPKLTKVWTYLWLNVFLKVIDNISWWTISSDDNDLAVRCLDFRYPQFLRLLPHNLCEVTSAALKSWTSKVIADEWKEWKEFLCEL